MTEISLTDGMQQLLDFTSADPVFEHVIISDSNSVFIDAILKEHKLAPLFQVFTNPARFDEQGCLHVDMYHRQDWCHLSTVNLCKGHILKEFIRDRQAEGGVSFNHIVYVGDGFNDLCPGLQLRPSVDALMPRVDFKLFKVLKNINENDDPVPKSHLKASVLPWTSGLDILNHVKSLPCGKLPGSSI